MPPRVDEPPVPGVVLRRKRCRFCRDELVTYLLDGRRHVDMARGGPMSMSNSSLDGRQVIYDVGSGEAVGQVVALDDPLTPRKRRPLNKRFSTPYLTVFQPALARIAGDHELKLVDLRVLLAILSQATHEKPEWDTDSKGLGAIVGLHPKSVLKSIAKLEAKGLLLRPRYGKLALAPDVAWRGSAVKREGRLKSGPDRN